MKSRLQPAMTTLHHRRMWRYFWLAAIVLIGLAGAAFAQDTEDPPARVGYVSYRQGGVVFAPQGDEEWTDLPANRPVTPGDRLWTDRGARAELQVGTTTLHLDGESHLGVIDLDERTLKVILQQGRINVRVRDVSQGENIEVDTPNLAFRALQAGDYRIDVDARSGETRVTVESGLGSLFGEGGESIQMGAGQNASFAGRFLAQVQGPGYVQDDFSLWTAERNRAEDQSVAARYVPRGVVGYAQLDPYGTWSQDPNYGAIWYPTVQVANWAPYRYGHWSWISPWGWTWIDDAPWGFAPFHYGRWTMIANRWAWVPGRLAHRPVYAPALVVFLGGGGTRLAIGSGPGVGWYPLAPGEAWWPTFRHSPRYVGFANHNINLNAYPRNYGNHAWRNRPFAVTAMGEDDFRRGRPVYRHWQPLNAQTIGHSQINVVPGRPDRHRADVQRPDMQRPATRLQAQPPAGVQTVQPAAAPRFFGGGREAPPAVREQFRAQREQNALQRDAERNAREQQRQAEAGRAQQDLRFQREQLLRQQQEQAARIGQRDQAVQRAQQEQAARMQQERAQPEAWRQQREHQQREASNVPPVRQFTQPVRPFVQAAPQQAVPVPQQQVRPVQQPPHVAPAPRGRDGERGWQRHQGGGEQQQPGWQGQGGWQGGGGRGHWR
ncbi:DUF6600 domain-containing protein [Ramlibacter sp. AN1133]|uniref:DUF6600 domain-containing protein n=1 Tax=Ramlibacter sp. AN1133 TaxID=3133429 RepID=UPI0030C53E3A